MNPLLAVANLGTVPDRDLQGLYLAQWKPLLARRASQESPRCKIETNLLLAYFAATVLATTPGTFP
jgi:hypothetical protein